MAPDNGQLPEKGLDPADVVQALPGMARIGVGAAWRTASWGFGASARLSTRVVKAARSGESVSDLFGAAQRELADGARELLGMHQDAEGSQVVVVRGQPTDMVMQPREGGVGGGGYRRGVEGLRDHGADLLRLSADVRFEETAHPAYERILSELAPDEARILRFMATAGPQPAVDVRSGKTPLTGSQMVAPGLSMIGAESGVRWLERLPAYLNNLFRLGLIWFSREPIENPLVYQVLEAQPDVLTAMRSGGRGKTIRRSICLTPFGEDFCKVCLPLRGTVEDPKP